MRDDNSNASVSPSRLAIYLSALVYPGSGQFVQKRWLVGLFYAIIFSICAGFLIVAIFEPMFANLRIVMDFADTGKGDDFHPISFVKVFSWLGISFLVYLAGLLDTYAAYCRSYKRRLNTGSGDNKTMENKQD